MIVTTIWAGVVAAVFCLAAYLEWIAIRDRVNGANGLIFLVSGFAGLASAPIGFALLWMEADFATALRCTAAMAIGGGLLWWGLLSLLGRLAKAPARQRR